MPGAAETGQVLARTDLHWPASIRQRHTKDEVWPAGCTFLAGLAMPSCAALHQMVKWRLRDTCGTTGQLAGGVFCVPSGLLRGGAWVFRNASGRFALVGFVADRTGYCLCADLARQS